MMVKVATIVENGAGAPFEVRLESSCGVHTVLKTLAPGEKFTLERNSSDTYSQHWVVMGSALVISFSSDELVDNDRIAIVHDGTAYTKVVSPRVLKSHSMPNRRSPYVQPEGEEGPSYRNSAWKPPLGKGFKRFFNSLIRRGSEEEESDRRVSPNMHPPSRLHSI